MLRQNICAHPPEHTALYPTDRNPNNLGRKTFFRDDLILFNKITIIMETESLSPKLRNNPKLHHLLLYHMNLFKAYHASGLKPLFNIILPD
jgi:hypothetical protein